MAAYLQGDFIDGEVVYCRQPAGSNVVGSDGQPMICVITKPIYGIPQAGRRLQRKIFPWCIDVMKLRQLDDSDDCVFVWDDPSGKEIFSVGIYVDNMQIVHSAELNESGDAVDANSYYARFMKRLRADWDIVDEGPMTDLLGIDCDKQPPPLQQWLFERTMSRTAFFTLAGQAKLALGAPQLTHNRPRARIPRPHAQFPLLRPHGSLLLALLPAAALLATQPSGPPPPGSPRWSSRAPTTQIATNLPRSDAPLAETHHTRHPAAPPHPHLLPSPAERAQAPYQQTGTVTTSPPNPNLITSTDPAPAPTPNTSPPSEPHAPNPHPNDNHNANLNHNPNPNTNPNPNHDRHPNHKPNPSPNSNPSPYP